MSIKAMISAAIMLSGCLLMADAATPVSAQSCDGRVFGLSGRYNLATGSGFLAVRARPNSGARMVGQLFNGDRVAVFDRHGNWYRVARGPIEGWANRRWLRTNCGF